MNRREFLAAAGALALVPRAALGPEPAGAVALVTADLESRLVAVDLSSGRIRAHIGTLPFPRSVERVGDVAVVAHPELGAVSLVRGFAVEHVLRGLAEPRYTAAHPDGRHAYVTDAKRGELVAIDVRGGRVLARVTVGRLARHVSIDPSGRTVWVALGTKAREVAVVDVSRPSRPRLARRFEPPFRAHDVGFAPDGRHVWVSSGDRFELAVYDLRTGRIASRPSGDWPPQHVTFAGERAYVTSGWSGTLRVHRVDGTPLVTNPVPVGSYNVQAGGGFVVTPSLGHGTLTVVDEQGRVLRRERIARSSHDACVL